MNIVVLNGSPRSDGNTSALIKQLSKGVELSGNHQIETINVTKKNLLGCLACEGCRKNDGNCVLKDDSSEIITQLVNSDMIIFATPVYWWGVSAQLKIVIDKFYSTMHLNTLKNKKIGVLSVGAGELSNPQYELISQQFVCISQFLDWEILFNESVSAYERNEVLKDEELLNRFKSLGTNL